MGIFEYFFDALKHLGSHHCPTQFAACLIIRWGGHDRLGRSLSPRALFNRIKGAVIIALGGYYRRCLYIWAVTIAVEIVQRVSLFAMVLIIDAPI